MTDIVRPGLPYPLGASPHLAGGTNFAVSSEVADAVEVCLFTADGSEQRVELPRCTAEVFHGHLPHAGPGTRYGLRVHGPWDPANGLRCNADKLLLDPYATAIEGGVDGDESLFAHHFDDAMAYNDTDSAARMPRCVVTDRAFDWGKDSPPRIPLTDTVVYETHVKGISQRHPDVPEDLRGSYAGLGHPVITGYLTDLGVTAVELLPVHQFVQDSHLADRGLRNYWGYNSIGFLAPHNEYSSAGQAGEQVDEFKTMVRALHAAGLEVILDVVYNHTAEGNHEGPSLSLKGIDNPAYYRLVDDDRAHYFDTTGTGNSLNVGHPSALRLIMDSLRYWVSEMHVDGFTLADLTAYNDKHNDANGEDNNDGESNNSSWNCGTEGPTDDEAINALRERQRRNLLATLLLSAGVPMILGGDEIARTQRGNNNAYCQDDELSWYDWAAADADLLSFTRTVLALRRENPSFRPDHYLAGAEAARAQMILYRAEGKPMQESDWDDPGSLTLTIGLDGRQIEDVDGTTTDERFLLLINGHHDAVDFTVPGSRGTWAVVLTTDVSGPDEEVAAGATLTVVDRSMTLLQRR